MRVIYIAGPFRGRRLPDGQYNQWEQAQNIYRAESLALLVWELGAVAICPHANTAHYQGALPDKTYLEGDLEILRRCDAVLMTPYWKQSAGARDERERALELKIPVFESLIALKRWLRD